MLAESHRLSVAISGGMPYPENRHGSMVTCSLPREFMPLLESEDPAPVIIQNLGGDAKFFIICDHAGCAVPRRLGRLGLPEAAFERHIAWDIGAGALARRLGEALDAPVIAQAYSRLVVDCNRAPDRDDFVPVVSDGTPIPGNVGLSPEAVAIRREAIYAPYHAAIAAALDARGAARTILVLVHSFTPQLRGGALRPWWFGVLHDGRSPASARVLERLRREADGPVVGDNQPYALDGTDFTVGHHGLARGLDYVELEVRQDLIAEPAGQAAVARRLARVLNEVD